MQSPVAETILTEAKTLPEGALISAKELLHLGNRAAIDQALSRLEKRKELMRVGRGAYARPVHTRFGIRAPSAEKVVSRLADTHAEIVVPHGAAAANALGLTTQVPTKVIYYTSGPSRSFKLGAQIVEMKHAQNWCAGALRPLSVTQSGPQEPKGSGPLLQWTCRAPDIDGSIRLNTQNVVAAEGTSDARGMSRTQTTPSGS